MEWESGDEEEENYLKLLLFCVFGFKGKKLLILFIYVDFEVMLCFFLLNINEM